MKAARFKITKTMLEALLHLPSNVNINYTVEDDIDKLNHSVSIVLCGEGLPESCELIEGHRCKEVMLEQLRDDKGNVITNILE